MLELDLLLRNVDIIDVFRLRTFSGWIGIRGGRFIYVEEGDPPKTIIAEVEKELGGLLLVPGLIDSHMHIDSSYVTPRRFAEAVLPFGTTTILNDSHEMGGAGGENGVQWMIDASKGLPLRIYHSIPSCIPATKPEIEYTETVFTAETVKSLAAEESVLALGEVMDYRGLIGDNERLREITQTARRLGLRLEGHIPTLQGLELSEYLSYGISSDHTLAEPEKILEQMSKGVSIMLQTKSITQENILLVNSLADKSQVLLVTDDLEPFALQNGHLSQIVQIAMENGMPIHEAIASATIRPARYLGLHDLGGIAPGYKADFMVMEKIDKFPPFQVYVGGSVVAEKGEIANNNLPDLPSQPPNHRLPGPFTDEDFRLLPDDTSRNKVSANSVVILNDDNTLTGLERIPVEVEDGFPLFLDGDNLAMAAVFTRDGANSSVGILKNSGIRSGAFASTVAHDSHNLLVIGRDVTSMTTAANKVMQMNGGIAIGRISKVLSHLALPILGIVSDDLIENIAEDADKINSTLLSLGMTSKRPLLLLTLMTLSVSPHYKFTDKGIIDTEKRWLLPPWE